MKKTNRYFGISLTDRIFDDFIKEFNKRRKFLDMRKFLGLFPDFDSFIPMLKMETLDLLMPELVEEYGKDRLINIFLNPAEEDEETKKAL